VSKSLGSVQIGGSSDVKHYERLIAVASQEYISQVVGLCFRMLSSINVSAV